MTNPGYNFILLRELCGTLWDLVGHQKIDLWHYAHVSIVEFRENHESGLRLHFEGLWELWRTLWDLVGHPKIDFCQYAHAFMV
jgi:hypothetical protein